MESNNTIEELKKRIQEHSIHISELTPKTKTRFKELAKEEFKDHYGWTLKWLLDFRDGILSSPGEEVLAKISILESEIVDLRTTLVSILNKVNEEKKPELVIKSVSGRRIERGVKK